MKIGNVALLNPTILAPLAGITNLAFRRMVKDLGCGLVCTEMISAKGLIYRSEQTQQMLASVAGEKPLSVQLFGADPDAMAEAAAMVEAAGADIIDINCGCAVKKVMKNGAGAALMKNPETVEQIIARMRRAVNIPLTIKMRSGWDGSGEESDRLAGIAEANGCDAVTIHPRTVRQRFSGSADWSVISAIKQKLSIPVIGNGDIRRPEDALRMMAETGCDAVMIGRAALGNPWIFSQIHALLESGTYPPATPDMRFAMMQRFLDLTIDQFGEEIACKMIRGRLGWLARGLRDATGFRTAAAGIHTRADAEALIRAYRQTFYPL
jgi:tRNA-dihydrouridine synthase B